MRRQDAVLIGLLAGPATRLQLEHEIVKAPITGRCMRGLLLDGWVTRSSETEISGFPKYVFTLTNKGRAYAERLAARQS